MKIAVFGLGYVGAVSAACLASDGHNVIGVDPNQTKIDLINAGQTPIIEAEVGEMISAEVTGGRLRATTQAGEAVLSSEISLICVGTPSELNGNLDLSYVRRVCEEIGDGAAGQGRLSCRGGASHDAAGHDARCGDPDLEAASGQSRRRRLRCVQQPRVPARRHGRVGLPPSAENGDRRDRTQAGRTVAHAYAGLDAPVIRTAIEMAEMVKYVDNNWHALKVAFANEIGNDLQGSWNRQPR